MLKKLDVQHVFIVGSKGIPGNYGGYETFVDKLTEYHQNNPNLNMWHAKPRIPKLLSIIMPIASM